MKYVYIIHTAQYMTTFNAFEYYDRDAYSSLKKAEKGVKNRMKTNKAFNIQEEETLQQKLPLITYNSLTDDGNKTMIIRHYIEKLELK